MSNRIGLRAGVLLLCLTAVAGACSSGPSTDGSLADTRLVDNAVEELDRICFEGVDVGGDLGNLELLMSADGIEPISLLLFLDGRTLYTTAPLHPVTPGSGGEVTLQFVDGDDSGPEMTLSLAGLPGAPGAWDAVVAALEAELDSQARRFGSSLEEIAATPVEAVSDDLLLAKVIQLELEQGLADLPRGAELELSEGDLRVLDALVAKLGLVGLIEGDPEERVDCVSDAAAAAASDEELGPTPVAGTPAGISPHVGSGVSSLVGSRIVPARFLGGGTCLVHEIEISNGDQLAEAVSTGRDAQISEGGAEQRVLRDIGTVTQVGENLPRVYGDLISAVGVMFTTIELWYTMEGAVYPTAFDSLAISATLDVFNEDFTQRGRVTGATVVASSTGFNGAEAFAAIAAEFAELFIGEGVGRVAGGLGEVPEGRLALFLGGKVRKSILQSLIEEFGDDYLDYCPQTWSVDIADHDYVDIQAIVGRFTEDKDSLEYWPDESLMADAIGEDIVRIRAKAEVFSGLTIEADIPVEALRIVVTATPGLIEVDSPGAVVDITAEIANADSTTLVWNTPRGAWADGVGADTNGGGTRPLMTPSEPFEPFVVEIRSTSNSGLRFGKTESDPRNDTVEVRLKQLFIRPDPGSVVVRGELDFIATDAEGTPQPVTWTATGGTIESRDLGEGIVTGIGAYTAGNEPGTYTVTATKTGDSGVSATATVEILEECNPVGTWRVREQEFLDQLSALGPVEFTNVSGAWYVIFNGEPEGGQFIEDYDAWTFRSTTTDGNLLTTMSGTRTGEWDVAGAVMNVSRSESTIVLKLVLEDLGLVLPGGSGLEVGGLGDSSAPFTCTGNVMTTTSTQQLETGGSASLTLTADKQS